MDTQLPQEVSDLIERFERMFAAIPAIYSGVKANHTMSTFHTDEESTLIIAWFFKETGSRLFRV